MKTKLYVCTLTAALVAAFAAFPHSSLKPQSAHAANGYSATSFKGTYGYTLQGLIGANSPLSGVGLMVADGAGNVSGTETVQAYGSGTQTLSYQGTYTVNNDGSGSLVLTYPAPPVDPNNPDAMPAAPQVAHYNFVIVDSNLQLKGARSDNGTFVTADFRLQ